MSIVEKMKKMKRARVVAKQINSQAGRRQADTPRT
jgi:hypothetical protein